MVAVVGNVPSEPSDTVAPPGPPDLGRIEPQLVPRTWLGDPSGVTEIRVHGVGGTTPAEMLGDLAPTQVAGNRVAGFYRTADVAPGRHVEAYSWGGLTSRSRLRALWIFLLPFMLANLAGWTSLPRKNPDPALGPVHGFRLAAARLAALALTLSVLMTTVLLVMDVVAYQCGAQTACATSAFWLAPLTWGDLPANPAHRLVAGAGVMALVLAVFGVLSVTSRDRYEAIEPPVEMRRRTGPSTPDGTAACHLPGGLAHRDFWCGADPHTRLTRAHLAAGLLVVATTLALTTGSLAGAQADLGAAAWRVGGLAVGALSFVLVLVTMLWEQAPITGRPHLWPATAAIVLAAVSTVAVGFAAWRQPAPAVAVGGQTPGITLAFNLVWVVIGLALLPVAVTSLVDLRGMFARDDSPSHDGIGWISPFSAVGLGIIIAQAVLLSLVIYMSRLLSGGQDIHYLTNAPPTPVDAQDRLAIVLPPMVATVTSYFVWLSLLLVTGFAVAAGYRFLRAGAPNVLGTTGTSDAERDYLPEAGEYADGPHWPTGREAWISSAAVPSDDDLSTRWGRVDRRSGWTRTVARWQFLARAAHYVSSFVNTVALVAAAVAIVVWILVWTMGIQPPRLWVEQAVAVALLIPPALAGFIVLSWRNLSQRRIIGTLWDVGTFWPRSFHPFAPPCYAERAVPELTRRVWWLNDNGGEVVVTAHSQGSVLAAATALRHDLEVDDRPRFALVTFGSPLRKLYNRAFPAYWSRRALDGVLEPQTSLVHDRMWTNVYYFTDYIGGTVGTAGVDRRLPDPASSVYVYGQHEPGVVSHTGYQHDARFRGHVAEVVEAVAAARANRKLT